MRRIAFAVLVLLPLQARAAGLTVFAAASLTDAFRDIGVLWQARGHQAVVFSFASSSTLAQQILHGAPADVFVSADEAWMDRSEKGGRIEAPSRIDIAANRLILVTRGTQRVDVAKAGALVALLGADGRLAVGDPAHVPAGIYAAQSLKKLGLWDSVKDRLAPAEDVRAAVLLVGHGEAPAGIAYATDIVGAPALHESASFPDDSHDPIRYPAAATTHGGQEAKDFVAFLRSDDAGAVLHHYGFLPP